jgi:hypothetical protein
MRWYVNDLSLRGQFSSVEHFKQALIGLLTLRQRRPDLRDRIYCSNDLVIRPVTQTHTLHQAIHETRDRFFIEQAIRWLGNAGPFWNDSRQGNDEDLFYWKEEDVTNQGLGEAARRRLDATDASAFSFVQPNDEFDKEVLCVTHGFLEQPIEVVEVQNCRSLPEIEAARIEQLTGWESMLVIASAKNALQLAPNLIDDLKPRPFHNGIAERLLQLLTILDRISCEIDAAGELTQVGMELVQLYFVGKKALFSDENSNGTNVFMFADPDGGGDIECPWHGKVKMGGQFRIHFQWPKPKGQERLKIVYIGEKLTKQ